MKLTPTSVKNLKVLLQTVSIAKIDRIIIEDGSIRGVDEDQTVVIISDKHVPDFGEARVGLNRLSILANRINLFDANEDFTVEAVETPSRNDDGSDISSLKLASKGSKFEYRCARVDTIKAPRRINDEMVWQISISQEDAKVAISAVNTIASEQIALVAKASGEVLFEVVDGATQDSFATVISNDITWIGDEDDEGNASFVFYYSVKALIPLLKAAAAAGEASIKVGEEGMLQIEVNGHEFTLLPRESDA